MIRFTFLFTILIANFAISAPSDSFVSSWENAQNNSKYVEEFVKVEPGIYKIKFSKMPFQGTLKLISYDTETIAYQDSPITTSGIAIVELVELPNDFIEKYNRIYFNWSETNELFYNSETNSWITAKQYRESLTNMMNSSASEGLLSMLLSNWNYIFILIVVYFVLSNISNSRKVNLSLKLQQEAIKTANDLQEQAIQTQTKAVEMSKKMHQQTNDTLKEILVYLKSK